MSDRSTAASSLAQVKREPSRRARPKGHFADIVIAAKGVDRMAQVRLRADEAASLDHSMEVLQIGSTSEALREGLRLLHREATEIEAATNIREFYQGESAPLPEGVLPVDEADLLAADSAEW